MRDLLFLSSMSSRGFSTCAARRATRSARRIRSDQTSDVDPEPFARRAPNLRIQERLVAGLCSLWIKPSRLRKVALAFKTSTLLSFHRALVQRKYRLLFSPKQRTKPGPKGPAGDLIRAVVEMKKRNSTWGCPQIADQINLAFGKSINKDVVRRILALHYQPAPNADGPSWLTFLGHTKDSLWSLALFCCESMTLRTHWVLVVMDHYTRRIIGFGIHVGVVDGEALCRMFKQAIRGVSAVPRYLSSDHDPLLVLLVPACLSVLMKTAAYILRCTSPDENSAGLTA